MATAETIQRIYQERYNACITRKQHSAMHKLRSDTAALLDQLHPITHINTPSKIVKLVFRYGTNLHLKTVTTLHFYWLEA